MEEDNDVGFKNNITSPHTKLKMQHLYAILESQPQVVYFVIEMQAIEIIFTTNISYQITEVIKASVIQK